MTLKYRSYVILRERRIEGLKMQISGIKEILIGYNNHHCLGYNSSMMDAHKNQINKFEDEIKDLQELIAKEKRLIENPEYGDEDVAISYLILIGVRLLIIMVICLIVP